MIRLAEKSACRFAADRGLRITSTLGVVGEVAARGLADLAKAIDQLRKNELAIFSRVAEGDLGPIRPTVRPARW